MFCIAACQIWFNSPISQFSAMWLGVVRSICEERIGTLFRVTGFAPDWRNLIHKLRQLCHVMLIGSGQRVCQRNPVGIGQDMVFTPLFPAICWIRPRLLTSSDGSHGRAVHSGPRPVDHIGRSQPIQQLVVQTIPDSCCLPFLQTTPTRHSTATTCLIYASD